MRRLQLRRGPPAPASPTAGPPHMPDGARGPDKARAHGSAQQPPKPAEISWSGRFYGPWLCFVLEVPGKSCPFHDFHFVNSSRLSVTPIVAGATFAQSSK